ncbi:MAG TPA: lysophospholipid acyltransferase family protein [Vicinamibacteria bacterium]|nr:lysophospholipid acyltransferase family protein [Vicinamibacteria bacterium]
MPRVLLSLPLAALLTVGVGLASILAGFVRPGDAAPRRLERVWARALLRLWGVDVLVSGAEHVPRGPAVFAANHASVLDIPLLFGYLPADFRIVHKRSLYLVPVIGLYLYLAGHIGIDRANPFRARRSLARAAARIAGGASVAVFPEGTRSRDESVRPFKKGSFVLALEAGVPVVPVSLCGVKRLTPHGLMRLRSGIVRLAVHQALPTAGRGLDQAGSLARQAQAIVSVGCERV